MSLPAVVIEDPDLIRNAASPSDVGSTGINLLVERKYEIVFGVWSRGRRGDHDGFCLGLGL